MNTLNANDKYINDIRFAIPAMPGLKCVQNRSESIDSFCLLTNGKVYKQTKKVYVLQSTDLWHEWLVRISTL